MPLESPAPSALEIVPGAPAVDVFMLELLDMSSDAMAQVDPQSGILTWRNRRFDQLARRVGNGDGWTGRKVLFGQFLQGIPCDETHATCTIFACDRPSIELHSVTRVLRPGVLVWTLRWADEASEFLNPTGNESVLQDSPKEVSGNLALEAVEGESDDPPAVAATSSSAETVLPDTIAAPRPIVVAEPWPTASDYPDPQARVVVRKCGRDRPVLLWRRYGRKSIWCPAPGERGEGPYEGKHEYLVDRIYFRCRERGCRARLKVDVDQRTALQLNVSPIGTHDHHVQITQAG
eukprot:TRINITY_DN7206_c0_g1_i1.p1 TRINITY_DN7206_c0_g1~~TRINITY_DN7206_c0_g1_i1.p1  ORF type:complete len:291 (-),score=41.45 TRINITY_DN7206_c0_g1_i1:411-1283(-)